MPLQLSELMRPFSHVLGETCLIPGSGSAVQVHPTRIRLTALDAPQWKTDFALKLTGPFKGFTVMQDLDRGFVRVYGMAQEGFLSFRLHARQGGVTLTLERCPKGGVVFVFETGEQKLERRQQCFLPVLSSFQIAPPSDEKLHFGCHKKQDWTFVKRRLRLDEILPFWFALGRYYPHILPHFDGTAELLKQCQLAIDRRERVHIGSLFLTLFQVGFRGVLTPRLSDTDFQGIVHSIAPIEGSPLALLSHGATLIRSLFCHVIERELAILPCLPTELHAGSFCNVVCSDSLKVDIKWSKKVLRHLTIHSYCRQTLCFKLQKQIRSFRLGNKRFPTGLELDLEAGKTYFFDRFEK